MRLACGEPVLRRRSVIGAAQFAAFSCFWTTVTFVLAGRSFRFSQAEIGLFALTGAAGAGCAMLGGRLRSRRRDLCSRCWPERSSGCVTWPSSPSRRRGVVRPALATPPATCLSTWQAPCGPQWQESRNGHRDKTLTEIRRSGTWADARY